MPKNLIVDYDPEKLEHFDFQAYIEGAPQEKKYLRIDMIMSVNRHKSSSVYGRTLAGFGSKEVIKFPLTDAQNEIIDRI